MLVVTVLGGIAVPLIGISKAASASTGFFAMIDAPAQDTTGLKEPEVSAHEDITFRDVTFAYPSRPDVKVLNKLNATFRAGKLTAIVGPSGSGKSTIVGLLERWYQIADQHTDSVKSALSESHKDASGDNDMPRAENKESVATDDKSDKPEPVTNSGSINIGAHDIQSLDLNWWRSQIGLVQQEPFAFNDTIYKNVAYGLVGSKWENDDDETKRALVEEACKEAFADEFISRLPSVCLI
jgi:ABC-type multidrug transport system fused ATPase/permease subunit